MKYKTNKLVETKTPIKLPGGNFLLILESHGSDDYHKNNVWSHHEPNKFNFSKNIAIIAATYILNGCAVVVEKNDPTILEVIKIFDPKVGEVQIVF